MRSRIGRVAARFASRVEIPIENCRPVISVTFDDVPMSACRLGAGLIEQAGGRATFYASGGLESVGDRELHTPTELLHLHKKGHEVGCHGFSHMDYTRHSDKEIIEDLKKNRDYFSAAGIPQPTQFAYPFGSVNPRVKRICAGKYETSRGVEAGTMRTKADRTLLKSVPLHVGKITESMCSTLLEDLKNNPGWLVFYTHGVTEAPGKFDTTPQLLAHMLKRANELNIEIVSVSNALNAVTKPAESA